MTIAFVSMPGVWSENACDVLVALESIFAAPFAHWHVETQPSSVQEMKRNLGWRKRLWNADTPLV